MLAQVHRFHGLGSLNFAYKRGRAVRGKYFSIRYVANERRQTYRVAVVVSKKVAKSAVTRNRLRRKIFAAVRLSGLPPTSNYDVIVSVYDAALTEQPFLDLQQQVQTQFRQADLL